MHFVRTHSIASLVALALAALWSIATADDADPSKAAPAAEEAPKDPDSKDPDSKDPAEDPKDPPAGTATAEEAKESLASPPAVALFRGGTLGIPTPVGSRSIQASSTLKLEKSTDGRSVDFDFMAKVGGVNLYDKVMVDIVGEQYQQALPVVTLGGPSALPAMTTVTVKSAGMRVLLRGASRDFDVYRNQAVESLEGEARTGAREARRVFAATSGDWYSLGLRALHPDLPGADEAGLYGFAGELMWQRVADYEPTKECKQELAQAKEGAVASEQAANDETTNLKKQREVIQEALKEMQSAGGPTVLSEEAQTKFAQLTEVEVLVGNELDTAKAKAARATENRKSLTAALEKPKTVCGPSRRHTYFLSLSTTYLNSQRLTPEGEAAVSMPEVFEARIAGGAELQSGTNLGKYLLPRVGFYGAVSGARWKNPSAMDGASDTVNQWQAEFALYTSGHFTSGFSGQFAVGVLVPYGHDAEPQAFINITPTIGASLGGS